MFITILTLCLAEVEPEVVWSKDGKVIKQKKKDKRIKIDWNVSDDTYFLEINESTVEDSGKYTVTVSNKGGSVEESVDVTVKLPAPEVKEEEVSAEAAVEVAEAPEVKEEAKEAVVEEVVVKVPEFAMSPQAVTVTEGESFVLKFRLVEGRAMCYLLIMLHSLWFCIILFTHKWMLRNTNVSRWMLKN